MVNLPHQREIKKQECPAFFSIPDVADEKSNNKKKRENEREREREREREDVEREGKGEREWSIGAKNFFFSSSKQGKNMHLNNEWNCC